MPRPPKPGKKCKCKRDPLDKTIFIAEVYKRRELWDKRLGHVKRDLIDKLWLEVGAAIGCPAVTEFDKRRVGASLRVKWKNLKDAYRKEAKRVLDEPGYLPRWLHYDSLMFLNNQFDFKNDKENQSEPRCSVHLSTDFQFEETFREEEYSQNEDSMGDPLINEDSDTIFIKEELEEYNEEPTTTTQINLPKEEPAKSEEKKSHFVDEEADLCFFKSLVPHMKQLNPQESMELKIKIHELVFNSVYRKNK